MTQTTTTETINNKLCTVIRRPFDAEKVRESLAMGVPTLIECYGGYFGLFVSTNEYNEAYMLRMAGGGYYIITTLIHLNDIKNTATILPALPRNPKPEDAALLHRYAAEGIYLRGRVTHPLWDQIEEDCLITPYTTDAEIIYGYATGNRVDVAIEGAV